MDMSETRIAASYSRAELDVMAQAIGRATFPGCQADVLPSNEVKDALLNSLIARGTLGLSEEKVLVISPSASILFAPVLAPVFTVTAEVLGVDVAARFVWYVLEHTTVRQEFSSSLRQIMTFEALPSSELLADIVLGLGISKAPAPTGSHVVVEFPEIMASYAARNRDEELDPAMRGSLDWIREAHNWPSANSDGGSLGAVSGVALGTSIVVSIGSSGTNQERVRWIQDDQGGRWLVHSDGGRSKCVATDGLELVSLINGAFEVCAGIAEGTASAVPIPDTAGSSGDGS
jgi:hypothetical protein